jgi:hypothetical protein
MTKEKRNVGTRFAGVLAFISIYGFVEIILEGLINYSILKYSSTVWLGLMGVGFLLAARPINLYEESKRRFTDNLFSRMVTLIIGVIAIVAGMLSLPQINVEHQILGITKSIISIIAIIFISFKTWIAEN